MTVVQIRNTKRVKLQNTGFRTAFADLAPDGLLLQAWRVVLAGGATAIENTQGNKFLSITATPGVEITALED